MKKVLSAFLALVLTALCLTAAAQENTADLRFRNGEFKILHLTDTQDDHHPSADMLNLLKMSIEREKPDLIVFTGDLVEDSRDLDMFSDDEPFKEGVVVKNNDETDHDATLENINIAAGAVLSVFEESGIPFAIAQGNNDYKCSITNEEWLEIYSRYPGCITFDESDDEEGRIDYHLEIKGDDGSDKFNLWLMDTGRSGISEQSVDWYREKASEITAANGGEPVPAIAFQHIHDADIGNLFTGCSMVDDGVKYAGGKFIRLDKERAKGEPFFGYAPCEQTYEFKAWKEQGDVIGAFFGHQHVEGFSGIYDGIELGFTYGCEFAKTGPYGYRVITLHEDDLTNYDNVSCKYTGSVKTGNAKIEEEEYKAYKDDPASKALLAPVNFMLAIVNVIISLFL